MNIEERILQIRDSLITRENDADLPHEIRGLLNIIDDPIYQQKIRDALNWAEIYIDPKQRAAWDSEAQSGREAVQQFLFSDLSEAAKQARKGQSPMLN